ncbi:hypothetical protein CVIRNUC_003397 [Coccomyxa viridis]|uniref:Uncharacterized protein n=1 Tax=Coccomyxa viridis TaxID=1274662 RepID=A0AAV1I1T0_9CHLO|nr:hypothetical protein CVIRNUC_003397 [Coccomyxa viridis]
MLVSVLVQAASVTLATLLVSSRKIARTDVRRCVLVFSTTAAILLTLQVFAPAVAAKARRSMGLGLGLRSTRFAGIEAFDEDASVIRMNNVLYSGDIVIISSPSTAATPTAGTAAATVSAGATTATTATASGARAIFFQRNVTSNEIIMGPALDGGIQTNLSKLRIEATDHDPQVLKPISFGDTVYIKHNANVNNENTALFVKISDTLLSHQTGALFNTFILSNPSNAADTSYVQPGQDVVISNQASGGIGAGYMVIGTDSKITNKAAGVTDASKFDIGLERVAELGDRQLCICVSETLYP